MALFGLGQDFLIKPTRKGTGTEADELLHRIRFSNKPGGQCLLYQSMSMALKGMAAMNQFQDPGYSKWLIVLTDTVDLQSKIPTQSISLAQSVLDEMNKFKARRSLVCIASVRKPQASKQSRTVAVEP